MPRQRNAYMPQNLLTVYPSPSGLTDIRTGAGYNYGGLYVGVTVDLTEAEAQALSGNQCHEGTYRFVKIDSSATAANVKQGTIGLMRSLALGVNVITSYDAGLGAGLHPVVFLASVTAAQVTAGAYVWVQESGDASLYSASGISASAGTVVISTTNGEVTNGSTAGAVVGIAAATATGSALFRAMLTLPPVEG